MKISKAYVVNALVMIVSLAISFGIAEAGFRLFKRQNIGSIQFTFDPILGSIPVPNQHGFRESWGFDIFYTYTNDSEGHRIVSIKPLSFKNKYVFLGDSFTYGIGVNDVEIFSYITQQKLKKEGIQVVNAGNGGKGTDYALFKYKSAYNNSDTKKVIYFAHCNDIQDNLRSDYYSYENNTLIPRDLRKTQSFFLKKKFLLKSRLYKFLIANSHAIGFLKQVGIHLMIGNRSKLVVSYDQVIESDKGKKITKKYLDELVLVSSETWKTTRHLLHS